MKRSRMINIGNIQVQLASQTQQSKAYNPTNPMTRSLNSGIRKKEYAKQLDDNIMMLKKIHFAQPSIKFQDYIKHAEFTDKMKKKL